jgi:hypothetical protein
MTVADIFFNHYVRRANSTSQSSGGSVERSSSVPLTDGFSVS